MPHLLRVDASIDPVRSRSRSITRAFADAWRSRGPEFTVEHRDLHRDPVPHLRDAALHWAPRLRRADAAPLPDEAAVQDALIAQLLRADVLLVGAPMYNYSLPSTLKAWLDHLHVPGTTAPFDTDAQPMAGRPAVLVASRGGSYDPGTPTEGWDHAIPPLRLVLGEALGMRVSVIAADRTLADSVPAMAAEADRARADLERARQDAGALARSLP